jgi:hypothetical protein
LPGFVSGNDGGIGFLDDRCKVRRQMMVQRLQSWRSGRDERQWLGRLIAAMEQAARLESRGYPCEQRTLAAVRAQLARPAFRHPAGISTFSLRN